MFICGGGVAGTLLDSTPKSFPYLRNPEPYHEYDPYGCVGISKSSLVFILGILVESDQCLSLQSPDFHRLPHKSIEMGQLWMHPF
jgi:hypothetical protein